MEQHNSTTVYVQVSGFYGYFLLYEMGKKFITKKHKQSIKIKSLSAAAGHIVIF